MTRQPQDRAAVPPDGGEARDPAGSTPPPGADAPPADAHMDASAGEASAPADMAYYRVPPGSGAMMALTTLALPIAVVVLIVIALMVMF